jgi:hypothetical protein
VARGIEKRVSRHITQEVCPFSRKFSASSSDRAYASRRAGEAPSGVVPRGSEAWHPGTEAPSLVDLMSMDAEAWDSFSRGSALRRAGRAGFLRNVAVALGNWGSLAAVPPLVSALSDPEPLVRAHAAWALGEIGDSAAREALLARLPEEGEAEVREEIENALSSPNRTSFGSPGAPAR